MDTTLVGVTLLSMMMAASLSVIVWRMLRDERQRSEARVIALSRMAARAAAERPAARRRGSATRAARIDPRNACRDRRRTPRRS